MAKIVIQVAIVAVAAIFGVAKAGVVNGDQQPKLWDALAKLRGKAALTAEQIQAIYPNAVAGTDYPNLVVVPTPRTIQCDPMKPGFYADSSADGRCQVYDRCDINGQLTSYLCPNATLFNQITLVCDWFFNVDCSQSGQFADYSNRRLYQGKDVVLLDTPWWFGSPNGDQAAPKSLFGSNDVSELFNPGN
ncbi:hypothetical protein BV898_00317 [Hypsibius exemplaris]|uniref:Chitin-binding type-2 domain-containing protein n=1 Tax=Hypsibius exemplaris TaxID=2072580 RepID=A0A1W0XFM0_HYPEX|nr:hypothetical protein BV898_00317 [Hypsibius exemplaris]